MQKIKRISNRNLYKRKRKRNEKMLQSKKYTLTQYCALLNESGLVISYTTTATAAPL